MERKKKKRVKSVHKYVHTYKYYKLLFSTLFVYTYIYLLRVVSEEGTPRNRLIYKYKLDFSTENEYIKREAREREREIMLRLKKENREKSWERKSSRFSRFRDNEIYRWLDSVDVRESSSGTVSGTSNGVTVSTGGDDRVPSLFSCNFYDSLLPLPLLASHSLSLATIDINPFSLYVQEGVAWKITRVIE